MGSTQRASILLASLPPPPRAQATKNRPTPAAHRSPPSGPPASSAPAIAAIAAVAAGDETAARSAWFGRLQLQMPMMGDPHLAAMLLDLLLRLDGSATPSGGAAGGSGGAAGGSGSAAGGSGGAAADRAATPGGAAGHRHSISSGGAAGPAMVRGRRSRAIALGLECLGAVHPSPQPQLHRLLPPRPQTGSRTARHPPPVRPAPWPRKDGARQLESNGGGGRWAVRPTPRLPTPPIAPRPTSAAISDGLLTHIHPLCRIPSSIPDPRCPLLAGTFPAFPTAEWSKPLLHTRPSPRRR